MIVDEGALPHTMLELDPVDVNTSQASPRMTEVLSEAQWNKTFRAVPAADQPGFLLKCTKQSLNMKLQRRLRCITR